MRRPIRDRLARSLIFTAVASLALAQAAWACSRYVSTGRYQIPFMGHLVGKKTVKLSLGYGATYVEETFDVGTYTDYNGTTVSLRCDTYEPYLL